MPRPSNTMQRFVAFLRAINVGGHTVKMNHLRTPFESLGFANVETFIASGNVIFETPGKNVEALEKKIARALETSLGYEVATFIRSVAELAEIAIYEPFPASELSVPGHALHVGFLAASLPRDAQRRLLSLQTPEDEFHVHGREVYWLRRGRISESKFSGPLFERTIGMPATMRNTNTIRRLVAKYAPSR